MIDMLTAWRRANYIVPLEEQSPHTSAEGTCSNGASPNTDAVIPATEEYQALMAGCLE